MAEQDQDTAGSQRDVVAFLSDPASHQPAPDEVKRIDTHGAMVFLAGENVFKIKKAVRFSYMDFSTLEKRKAACAREIEVNRDNAPDIYLGTVAITREKDGAFAFDGKGETVEWAVRMRRFDETQALDRLADKGELEPSLLEELAGTVANAHSRAPVRRDFDQAAAHALILDQDGQELRGNPCFSSDQAEAFLNAKQAALHRCDSLLKARGMEGFVRRCHGDLHLKNIVRIGGAPVLFDAIEFDEDLATVDLLYDLAFLIMDLEQRGMRAGANLVLNTWLKAMREDAHLDALAALPAFLATRAGVRARVTASLSEAEDGEQQTKDRDRARAYLDAAVAFLDPVPPRLVAVGGLSGSGKTTIARLIAPGIGPAPGAVHVRSDVERKHMAGKAETERLDKTSYTQAATQKVYDRLGDLARRVLSAGHGAIVDAVFSKPEERAAIEAAAANAGVPFTGIWLDAPQDTLVSRVEERRGDASDATASVVREQMGYDLGEIGWHRVSAEGTPVAVAERARKALVP